MFKENLLFARRLKAIFRSYRGLIPEIDQSVTKGSSPTFSGTNITGVPAPSLSSGVVAHERGGLEADVSAYDGVVTINSGVTSAKAVGIADDNAVEVDGAPNSGEYAIWTENGIDGKTKAEINTDFARKDTRFVYVENPTATGSYPIGPPIPYAATITSVVHITDTGTVDWNIEKRSKLTPDVAGTDVFSADEQSTSTGQEEVSFNSPAISVMDWLYLACSSVASSPTELWVAVTFEED